MDRVSSRVLIRERNLDRSWTADILRVGENCRASIFTRRLRDQFHHVLFVESLGAREEEESRSDNQEQEDIDGTGEVEQ